MSLEGFGGETVTREDTSRLSTQLDAVLAIMRDGREHSLASLAAQVRAHTGRRATEASVSARIRDLRKKHFGGYRITRRRLNDGHHLYQLHEPVTV